MRGFKVSWMFSTFWVKGNVMGVGEASNTTRFSNICYHTKQVLTKISPFEKARLGLWVNQGRVGGGKRQKGHERMEKKPEKSTRMGGEKQRKKQQKKKITCY
jgi:hypothetical protein